jgi:predicted DNA-binding protein (UPF0251 family)
LPRNKKCRKLSTIPIIKGFKPFGLSKFVNKPVVIPLEEYEALNLADYQGLSQEEASAKMNISRPTFTRIYESVRKKIATAFSEGRSLIIEGGNVEFDFDWFKCSDCSYSFSIGKKDPWEDISCPRCKSKNTTNLNDCFLKGCGCCCKCTEGLKDENNNID